MSWQERDYADDERRGLGRPGGDWQGMRPTFDNPFTWSLPLGRIGGITVRVHIVLLLYIITELLRARFAPSVSTQTPLYFKLMAIAMASLFVIVLAHEFGHCLACRWVGGEADEILMWPLGGLAFCRPPNRWSAHLITVIGGPAVNVILCVVTGTILGLLTGKWWGVAIPNPLTAAGIIEPEVSRSLAHQALFLFNYTSLVLLLFNLIPVFPLDGGRIAQALLWSRMGYSRSMQLAVHVGFVGAIVLGIYGAVMQQWAIVGVAIFGGITCYITQKQLQWTDSALGLESDEYALSVHGGKEDEQVSAAHKRRLQRAQRQELREEQEAQEVDRILLKIAHSGMDSLTRSERGLLKRATDRKRKQEE